VEVGLAANCEVDFAEYFGACDDARDDLAAGFWLLVRELASLPGGFVGCAA
jgi:hypothetical protein